MLPCNHTGEWRRTERSNGKDSGEESLFHLAAWPLYSALVLLLQREPASRRVSALVSKYQFLIPTALLYLQSNKSDKVTSEDDVTNAKNSTPSPDANAKPQTATITPSDGSEGAEPATFSSPSVSQHQAVYQQPFLPVLYTHLPNMTSHPRLPQGISVESDGSDLPEGKVLHLASY